MTNRFEPTSERRSRWYLPRPWMPWHSSTASRRLIDCAGGARTKRIGRWEPPTEAGMSSRFYRRYGTLLLLIVYVFNQVDRAIFTVLMEPIKQDLRLSDTQLGFAAGPA